MPYPKSGEKRNDYIERCVRTLKHENPDRPIKECLGQCYGMLKSGPKSEYSKPRGEE